MAVTSLKDHHQCGGDGCTGCAGCWGGAAGDVEKDAPATSIWKYNDSRNSWDHMGCFGQESADISKRRFERTYPGIQFCISKAMPAT